MGYMIEDNCVNCAIGCINCGRRHQPVHYCDKCDDYCDGDNPLYEYEGQELCWNCYKDMFTQKICDNLDDTLCAECGCEAETLYLYEGDWVCSECLKDMAEKIDVEGDY